MKRFLLTALIATGIALGCNADQSVTIYNAPTGSGHSVARGCVNIVFDLAGFTGTIGGASYSNQSLVFALVDSQEGKSMAAVPYTVTSGTLRISEVR